MAETKVDNRASPAKNTHATGAVVALILLAVLPYLPALSAGFHADDFNLMAAVRSEGAWGAWSGRGESFFRPLVSLSLYADHHVWGLNDTGYHLTNILWHVLAVLLMYGCARRVFHESPNAREMALWAAAWFAVLPTHSEPVAWISGRTDLLATTFMLAAAWAHISWRSGRGILWEGLALFFCAAGLLSKESALSGPMMIAAFEIRRALAKYSRFRSTVGVLLALAVVVGLYAVLRSAVLGTTVGGYGSRVHLSFPPGKLMRNAIVFPLRVFIPYQIPAAIAGAVRALGANNETMVLIRKSQGVILLGCLIALMAILTPLWMRKWHQGWRPIPTSRQELLTGALWLTWGAVAALPTFNLTVSLNNTEGERYIYALSSACLPFATWLMFSWFRPPRVRRAIMAGLCGVSIPFLMDATTNWKDAGRIASSVAADAATHGRLGPCLVLSLPDNLNGAFVFRTTHAFRNALRLYHPEANSDHIHVTGLFHNLHRKQDGTRALRDDRMVTIEMRNPADRFMNEEDAAGRTYRIEQSPMFEMASIGRTRCEIILQNDPATKYILFYDEGRLFPLQ